MLRIAFAQKLVEVRANFLHSLNLLFYLLSNLNRNFSRGNAERTEGGGRKSPKRIVLDDTLQVRTVGLIYGQFHLEAQVRVVVWVRARFWVGWNYILHELRTGLDHRPQVELNEGLHDWHDTHRFKVSEAKHMQIKLVQLLRDHSSQAQLSVWLGKLEVGWPNIK